MKKSLFTKFILLLVILSSCNFAFAKSKIYPITSEWKYSIGDNPNWSSPSFTGDSSWDKISIPSNLTGDDNGFFWLRADLPVPSELKGQEIFLELGCCISSLEVFVDGILMGRHGTIEPPHVSHVDNTVVTIPAEAIKNGKVNIAIRSKNNASHVIFSQFSFVNKDRFISTKIYQPLLNTTVYYMMAAICFFLGCYFILQFAYDHNDKASLYFSLSLISISIYFLDMASDFVILPFSWQLGLSRLCLLLSIGFLALFMAKFFRQKIKLLSIIIGCVYGLFTILYCMSTKNAIFQETLFTISLLPIFGGIAYLYAVLVKALKQHKSNAKILITGISIALIFGVHDIIYQATGNIPFAWLQGFSFFFIDITMFIVVCIENINNKRSIDSLVFTTAEQKAQLDTVLEQAAELSKQTFEIAGSLNNAVTSVAAAAQDSATKANEIGEVISHQNTAINSTSSALSQLVTSVKHVKSELMTETEVVDTTVAETENLISGVNQVATVIESASNFSSSLGNLTTQSSQDIAKLVNVMESIKAASAEILGIVKIVSDFSNKTNMLSMNASIEAAHSGAAGKGFSVIAHQIKGLAEASNTQADKINEIARQINSDISNSFELSKNIQMVLENVAKEAVQTSNQVAESARSMEVQREAGKRISEATSMMSSSAIKVRDESEQQYNFSEQASSTMEELSASSQMAAQAVDDIINQTQLLSGQVASLKELAQKAQDTAAGLNELIQL